VFLLDRPLEMVVLQHLIHFQIYERPEAESLNDGWFSCSLHELRRYTGLSNSQQARYLASLEAQRYIKRQKTGSPGFRQIWIDFNRWYSLCRNLISTWEKEWGDYTRSVQ
jgi:DNA-binding MarR family transcriptional regulator